VGAGHGSRGGGSAVSRPGPFAPTRRRPASQGRRRRPFADRPARAGDRLRSTVAHPSRDGAHAPPPAWPGGRPARHQPM